MVYFTGLTEEEFDDLGERIRAPKSGTLAKIVKSQFAVGNFSDSKFRGFAYNFSNGDLMPVVRDILSEVIAAEQVSQLISNSSLHIPGKEGSSLAEFLIKQRMHEVFYMDNKEYHSPNIENIIDAPLPVNPQDYKFFFRGDDPSEIVIKERKKMSRKQEKELFLKYNAAKCLASKRINKMLKMQDYDAAKLNKYLGVSRELRNLITEANLPLVLMMAKKVNFPEVSFSDLVEEGNSTLLRAVERFDVTRGFKFSTYACNSIFKSFLKLLQKKESEGNPHIVEYNPNLEYVPLEDTKRERESKSLLGDLKELMKENSAKLTEVENIVLAERFWKDKTLMEVGKVVGVTNERVRQIQIGALLKLRKELEHGMNKNPKYYSAAVSG